MCGIKLNFVNFSLVFQEICIDCCLEIPDCVPNEQIERFAKTVEKKRLNNAKN
jgi:hypothetical protein